MARTGGFGFVSGLVSYAYSLCFWRPYCHVLSRTRWLACHLIMPVFLCNLSRWCSRCVCECVRLSRRRLCRAHAARTRSLSACFFLLTFWKDLKLQLPFAGALLHFFKRICCFSCVCVCVCAVGLEKVLRFYPFPLSCLWWCQMHQLVRFSCVQCRLLSRSQGFCCVFQCYFSVMHILLLYLILF